MIICLITYNRLDYTKKTLRYLWRTMTEPYYLIVVDNNSTDGTQKYLSSLVERGKVDQVIFNEENYYPGKACNIGWSEALENFNTRYLMRLDNDMELREGWYDAAMSYFKAIPELGQLGLDHEAIEHPKAPLRELEINGKVINPWPGCVGGPCIIRKSIWNEGIRWPEERWDDGRNSQLQEDSRFSKKIQDLGYLVGHMTENLSRTFANETNWADYPEYYKKTMFDRGYSDRLKKAGLIDEED